MKIGVPRETAEGENRVALVPESVKSLLKREGVAIVVGTELQLKSLIVFVKIFLGDFDDLFPE